MLSEKSTNEISIADIKIGPRHPVFTIAEVGLAHDGSLGAAHAYIDAAADTGVSSIKFQTHVAEAESTMHEPFRVNVFPQDKTRYEYWVRTGFTLEEWRELADHARERGLVFLSSAFSFEAVDMLLECGVSAWKVASGEVSNLPLIRYMAQTGLPVLLSSGMSPWGELDQVVGLLKEEGAQYAIFQCTTAYPCPPETWGLNVIGEMQARYRCPVGLSDHSGTIVPAIAAAVLGASLMEFHVTFHRRMFGPDVPASLTFEETAELVRSLSNLRTALSNPVDKDAQAHSFGELRNIFTKSVVPSISLDKGTILVREQLALKKPGTGIPAAEMDSVIGKRLKRDVERDELLTWGDLENS